MGAPAKPTKLSMAGTMRTSANKYPMKVKEGGAGGEKMPVPKTGRDPEKNFPIGGKGFKKGGKLGIEVKLGSRAKQTGIDGKHEGDKNKLPMKRTGKK